MDEDGEVSRPAFSLNGPWREQLEWLLRGNGCPLIEYRGGLISLAQRPGVPRAAQIPGVPPDTEPKAGGLGARLDT